MSFYIVEGANGAGKTTTIKNLSNIGYKTLSSPNGTDLAKFLRSACRGTDQWSDLDKVVKCLLFSAARYDEYLRLVHNTDDVIIADRWWTSTYVYQIVLESLPLSLLETTIHPQEKIDCVFILGGDSEILIQRVLKERAQNHSHGICSWTKEIETMRKLNKIYDQELPKYLISKNIRCIKIDTTIMNPEEVQNYIINTIEMDKNAK